MTKPTEVGFASGDFVEKVKTAVQELADKLADDARPARVDRAVSFAALEYLGDTEDTAALARLFRLTCAVYNLESDSGGDAKAVQDAMDAVYAAATPRKR